MGLSRVLQGSFSQSRFRLAGVAALVGLSALACTKATDVVPVASIQLQPGLDSLEVGETYNGWVVVLRDASGNTLTGRPVAWESSNQVVATIDANGTVTGLGSGQSLITATAEGKAAQAAIKVLNPIVSIISTPDSFDLALTTTRLLNVQLVGPDGQALANRTITFSSANLAVATVGATGVVTPIGLGTTTITIHAGTKLAMVRVRVIGEPVASVRITPQGSVHVVRLSQTYQLGAECLNAAQQVLTGRTVTWNTTNPLVASVGLDGLITGVALGSASITATCETASTSVTAQVTPVPVSSVSVAPGQMTINVGQQGQLSATARDSANNVLSLVNRTVTWTSDNLPVATVSGQGVVSGVAAGTSNIQVSVDGVLSANVPVTVQNVPVASVTVNPAQVNVGFGVTMSAQCRDAQNNVLAGRIITWSSGSPGVATINMMSGVAQGVTPGISTITATCEGIQGTAPLTVVP